MAKTQIDRRTVLKSSALGLIAIALPGIAYPHNPIGDFETTTLPGQPSYEGFPNIDPEIIAEVVGKSHFDLDRVKELVGKRPELARSVWEWRFGDFESAIGAASHVGRRDIVQYLISNGARPSIFTFAMLGSYEVVKSMIDYSPGIQKTSGPHGISLLDHAYAGNRMKDKMSGKEIDNLKRTIDYLESLGDAGGEKYQEVTPEEQKKYLGEYKYDTGSDKGFTIQLNMRKMLSLSSIGGFGGALYKIGDNVFTYNGAPSVTITFDIVNNVVKSLTITDPDIIITADKIS